MLAALAMPAAAQFLPIPVIPTWLIGILTGNAKEATQLLNYGQLVASVANQIKQIKNEIDMLSDMGKNLKKLQVVSVADVSMDLNRLAQLIDTGQSIGYSVANLEQRYIDTYKGYVPATYGERRKWLETALDTSRGVIRLINEQHRQIQGTKSLLDLVRQHALTTEGRMGALQNIGELAHEQVSQLERLNVLLMADISSKQAFQATLIEDKAAVAAASERFFYIPNNLTCVNCKSYSFGR
jgi:P-type conjugative transfer protein TrbJ